MKQSTFYYLLRRGVIGGGGSGGGGSFTGLLDTYSGAAAAYSLRQLSSTYSGNAIKVRRSSDNAEQDIAFVNNELDTASLETFAGSGDAFVTTWYDQSGSGNDATQTTASDQPKIVSSGSTITEGSKPILDFNGTSNYLDASSVNSGNPKSIFIINKANAIGGGEKVMFDSVTTNQALLFKAANDNITIGFGASSQTSYALTTNYNLYSIMHNGSSSNAYINNSNQILTNANLGTNAFNGLRIGAVRGSASLFWNGKTPEFIVYASDQSSNRTGIETNINDFYSIY